MEILSPVVTAGSGTNISVLQELKLIKVLDFPNEERFLGSEHMQWTSQ